VCGSRIRIATAESLRCYYLCFAAAATTTTLTTTTTGATSFLSSTTNFLPHSQKAAFPQDHNGGRG